jgi:hypothetical protein
MTNDNPRIAMWLGKLRRLITWGEGVPLWLAAPALWLVATQLIVQQRTLKFAIFGEHRWREADTYALAYNFAHGSFDFFHPRIDVSRGLSGITGTEPPVLPWVTAVAMRVFGDSPSVGRWIVWLIAMAGLVALIALVRRVRDMGLALGVLVAFTLSPLALFELRQIQPDGPTGMIAAVAAYFLYRFARFEKRRDYLLGVGAYTLAVFMKGPGLALAPAMLWFACAARKVSFRQFVRRGVGVAIAVLLYFPWYRYAKYLRDTYNEGYATFGIDFSLKGIRDALADGGLLHNVFWFIYPTYATNWLLFPAVLVGLPAAFQQSTRRVSTAFLLWLLSGSAFLAAFSPHLSHHWYYGNLVLVPLAYFAGFGLSEAFRLFAASPRRRPGLLARWAALVVLVTLVVQRFMVPATVRKLAETVAASGPRPGASWMSDGHLTVLLCVLALALVAVQMMPLLWLRVTAALLLPLAIYWGMGRARRDSQYALRSRTHAAEEMRFRVYWLNGLRPLVNRYSTRADLFVVSKDGIQSDDPYYMYLPLRRGWSEPPKVIEKKGLSYYQQAGARFLLTYNRKPLPGEAELVNLGETKHYRLYCLDPKGCPALR